MEKEQKRELIKILLSIIVFTILVILDKTLNLSSVFSGDFSFLFPFFLYLICYLIVGYKVVFKAFRHLFTGKMFDETLLMTIATFGAFGLAIYRGINGLKIEGFDEACMVMILYQVGEWFQDYAVDRSKKSIKGLLELKAEYALKKEGDKITKISIEDIKVGDILVVNPGEKVAVDGEVIGGSSTIDTRAITGESLPREIGVKSQIISGSIVLDSQIEMLATKKYSESTVSKVIKLMETATDKKSKSETFITKFARIYTPLVVILALILMIVPSIITRDANTWIYRGLSFLVVSCPCALVISVPLSFFIGIGKASKCGILIKNSKYLEQMNNANYFIFDKTGTLTKGNLVVSKIIPSKNKEEILQSAYIAEEFSNHPIAMSIKDYISKNLNLKQSITHYTLTNISGFGVIATSSNSTILCGNSKLMKKQNIDFDAQEGTVVYVAKNDKYLGCIVLSDELKKESSSVISTLNNSHCKTCMLSGDNEVVAKSVALEVGVSEYYANLLPQDKVEIVETKLKDKNKKDVLCFIGDGINDAPVLTRADIGISMGGVGSDIAIEASDIVLMHDNLNGILQAKKIAKSTNNIVKQNVVFALFIKVAILVLSMLGITNMWFAIFGDVGVTLLTILNSLRINLSCKPLKKKYLKLNKKFSIDKKNDKGNY